MRVLNYGINMEPLFVVKGVNDMLYTCCIFKDIIFLFFLDEPFVWQYVQILIYLNFLYGGYWMSGYSAGHY